MPFNYFGQCKSLSTADLDPRSSVDAIEATGVRSKLSKELTTFNEGFSYGKGHACSYKTYKFFLCDLRWGGGKEKMATGD